MWSDYGLKFGRVYKHWKGGLYRLMFLAKDAETEELLVIYGSVIDPPKLWVRTLANFTESVEVDGQMVSRFELATEDDQAYSVS